MSTSPVRPLRIAVLASIAPKKLGSFEAWVVQSAREARRRGHSIEFWGYGPVHPLIADELHAENSRWHAIDPLLASLWHARRELARNADVIQLHLWAPRSRTALAAMLAWPARIIFVDHFSGDGRARPPRPRRLRALLDRLTAARFAAIVGVSEYVVRRTIARYPSAIRRTQLIYNGVDAARFRERSASGRSGGFELLAISSLIHEKGLHVALESLGLLRDLDVRLTIVGEGPLGDSLRTQADQLGLGGRVRMLGVRDDVEELLADCDALVHPALWDEAFGLAVAEAMAAGRPVIATAVGALPELVEHDVSGLLVAPDDARALANAIRRLVEDRALGQRLAQAARERSRRFSIEASVASYLDLSERVS